MMVAHTYLRPKKSLHSHTVETLLERTQIVVAYGIYLNFMVFKAKFRNQLLKMDLILNLLFLTPMDLFKKSILYGPQSWTS